MQIKRKTGRGQERKELDEVTHGRTLKACMLCFPYVSLWVESLNQASGERKSCSDSLMM